MGVVAYEMLSQMIDGAPVKPRVAARLGLVSLLVVVALAVLGCGSDGPGGAKPTLAVSAAASLKTAFTTYGTAFAEARARFSFAGSDLLAAQIRKGAKPDVFASANTALPEKLYADGLVERPIVFASAKLVLATPAGDRRVRTFADVAKPGVRLAIGARSVPVGAYTRTVLDKLPAPRRRAILAHVRSQELDVAGIIGKLRQGAVDAGFVYDTDVRASDGKLVQVDLPAGLPVGVRYAVALVTGARQPKAAKAFIYGLLADAGLTALNRAGFGGPTVQQ
jgi:molybdate transport system substrate-binding protein